MGIVIHPPILSTQIWLGTTRGLQVVYIRRLFGEQSGGASPHKDVPPALREPEHRTDNLKPLLKGACSSTATAIRTPDGRFSGGGGVWSGTASQIVEILRKKCFAPNDHPSNPGLTYVGSSPHCNRFLTKGSTRGNSIHLAPRNCQILDFPGNWPQSTNGANTRTREGITDLQTWFSVLASANLWPR